MGTVMDKEFTFVVSTGLEDAQSTSNKRRVRSAAALKSWDTRLAGIRKRDDWTRPAQHVKAGRIQRRHERTSSSKKALTWVKRQDSGVSCDQSKDSASTSSELSKSVSPAALTKPVSPRKRPNKLTGHGVKRQHLPHAPETSGETTNGGEDDDDNDQDGGDEPPHIFGLIIQHNGLLTPPDYSCESDEESESCKSSSNLEQPPPNWQSQSSHQSAQFSKNQENNLQLSRHNSWNSNDINRTALPDTPAISPSELGSIQLDPFNCSPVPCKDWFDGVLQYMLREFAPRGWPALGITTEQGLRWENFMTQHALSEPALYYVRLLFATGDLVRKGACPPQISYWLQEKAIKAINEALAHPVRGTSDPLILAVGRIALHESMYGDKTAAHTIHRPAQRYMIAMRGGMHCLNFPVLVKRLMRWSDRVMSMQSGTERMIPDDDEVGGFNVDTSVRILEKWVPQEGLALRQRMKVTDPVH